MHRGKWKSATLRAAVLSFAAFSGDRGVPTQAAPADEVDAADRDYSADLKRVPPVPAKAARSTFEIEPGFEIQTVAAEPLVASPVAMEFDEQGRMYVAEMIGYSENAADKLSRIRLLTDADRDGAYETSAVFADGLAWPTAVICYDGGIFVGAAPDILYFKDTDGDGKADVRRVAFTGFGLENVQGLLNSFRWGLDNRIHVDLSRCGAELRRGDQPQSKPLILRGRNFAFDPRTLEFEATSGASQHGYCFDAWGNEFTCHNSDHIQQIMVEDRYLSRNPLVHPPAVLKSIGVEGPAADVFRISPVEPWREIRTRLRVKGIVPGMLEGGGRAAGYFTSATGVTIYTGDAWPKEFSGNAFIGDVGSNLVHRKIVEFDPNSPAYIARRATPGKEFLASKDNWFRPVQFANSPDGNLYILDMYREVIEHPASLPPILKKHIDLTSGRDRGRIYRVVSTEQTPLAEQENVKRAFSSDVSTKDLVATLAHPNGWHRTTAARLLYEKNDPAAAVELKKLWSSDVLPEGKLAALYSLSSMKALDATTLLAALANPNPHIRENAVRLAGQQFGAAAKEENADRAQLERAVITLAADSDIRVRYQVAFALGETSNPNRIGALAKIARSDAANEYMAVAVLSSVTHGSEKLLHDLLATPDFIKPNAGGASPGRGFVLELAREIGARGDAQELQSVAGDLATVNKSDPALGSEMLVTLLQGAGQRAATVRKELAKHGDGGTEALLVKLFQEALTTAADENAKPAKRATAVAALSMGDFAQAGPVLTDLLQPRQPQNVQLAALATLGQFGDEDVAAPVLAAWAGMSPSVRLQAAGLLLSRAKHAAALLAAVETGQLAARDLDPSTIQRLKTHADEKIRAQAAKLLVGGGQKRAEIVDSYRDALQLTGDPAKGRDTFRKNCAICHRREGFGTEVGADLATVVTRTPDVLMMSVLDPNREVDPKYVQYTVLTSDGQAVSGIVSGETATSVTLTAAEKVTKTIPRADIEQMQSTGMSLMPEGFEKVLDKQAMADLIAYLRSQP